ncbi:hypothetical protein M434DRAFT_8033 [Hypoxylon sp. CO27-5]|nr:hypothetical protein M434DRAFT_8033 [Hypoxylon sp. CO27-5]
MSVMHHYWIVVGRTAYDLVAVLYAWKARVMQGDILANWLVGTNKGVNPDLFEHGKDPWSNRYQYLSARSNNPYQFLGSQHGNMGASLTFSVSSFPWGSFMESGPIYVCVRRALIPKNLVATFPRTPPRSVDRHTFATDACDMYNKVVRGDEARQDYVEADENGQESRALFYELQYWRAKAHGSQDESSIPRLGDLVGSVVLWLLAGAAVLWLAIESEKGILAAARRRT